MLNKTLFLAKKSLKKCRKFLKIYVEYGWLQNFKLLVVGLLTWSNWVSVFQMLMSDIENERQKSFPLFRGNYQENEKDSTAESLVFRRIDDRKKL